MAIERRHVGLPVFGGILIGGVDVPALAERRVGMQTGYALKIMGQIGDAMRFIAFPEPVRGGGRKVQKALFAGLQRFLGADAIGDIDAIGHPAAGRGPAFMQQVAPVVRQTHLERLGRGLSKGQAVGDPGFRVAFGFRQQSEGGAAANKVGEAQARPAKFGRLGIVRLETGIEREQTIIAVPERKISRNLLDAGPKLFVKPEATPNVNARPNGKQACDHGGNPRGASHRVLPLRSDQVALGRKRPSADDRFDYAQAWRASAFGNLVMDRNPAAPDHHAESNQGALCHCICEPPSISLAARVPYVGAACHARFAVFAGRRNRAGAMAVRCGRGGLRPSTRRRPPHTRR